MTFTVKHHFVSAIADDPIAAAAGEVLPQAHWNAALDVSGILPLTNGGTGTADGSGLPYVPYTGATSDVDLNGHSITASTYFGDGSNLTGVVAAAAGSSGQIQYNNGGVLGADAGLTWNGFTLDVAGDITASGALNLGQSFTITESLDDSLICRVINTSDGTSATSYIGLQNDMNYLMIVGMTSSGNTASGGPNLGTIYSNGPGGFRFDTNGGPQSFQVMETEHMNISSSGVNFNEAISVSGQTGQAVTLSFDAITPGNCTSITFTGGIITGYTTL